MKLFQYKQRDDWGIDRYITLLSIKGWSFFQGCVSTTVFEGRFPYLSIIMGGTRLLYVSFSIWKIGFTIEFLARSWRFND